MKIALVVLACLVTLIVIAGVVCCVIGARLPVDHVASVTGTVEASPEAAFAIITHIANGPAWRKEVKSVKVLPPEQGPHGLQDHWVEDLGHGNTMTFLAIKTEAPSLREVRLDVPGAAYGGTWTYALQPGPSPNQTILQITESGFIKPPIYRFMMSHIFGMTRNLDAYMHEIQAQAKKGSS